MTFGLRTAASMFLIGIAAVSFGCRTPVAEYYSPRFPVIPMPDRPQLADIPGGELIKMSGEAQTAVSGNISSLIGYARKLEAGIDEYNAFAETQNVAFRPAEVIPDSPMVASARAPEKPVWDGKSMFTSSASSWDGKSLFTRPGATWDGVSSFTKEN